MRRQRTSLFLHSAFAAVILSALLAASASASPAWNFEGEELTGSEAITGQAILSGFTIPGLTTSCKTMHYEMTISNSAGTGSGELTKLSFATCATNSKVCTVKTIGAEKLPWSVNLVTVAPDNYLIVEGVRIAILYSGAMCALNGTTATVTGTVGGLYDNVFEVFSFNASSSKATKTALKALGSAVEWNAVFSTKASGAHEGEALTVS